MAFNEAKAASSLTSLAVPIPTGTTAGDLLIAAVRQRTAILQLQLQQQRQAGHNSTAVHPAA